jgi:hypothetical protein
MESLKIVANWLVRLLGSPTRLERSSSRRHVDWLWLKRKLRQGLIAKAAGFRLAIGIEPCLIVVGVDQQETHRTVR